MFVRLIVLIVLIIALGIVGGESIAQDILSLPQTSVIAFTSDRDNQEDIYTMDAEGNHRKRLTNTPEWESDLAWSPDGKHLAFVRTSLKADNSFLYMLFVMDADGSNIRKMRELDYSYPTKYQWQPDSQHIQFSVPSKDYYSYKTVFFSIDHPDIIKSIENPYESGYTYSPDMSHIAYLLLDPHIPRYYLYIMQADMTHKVRIMDEGPAVWSPNSMELAFAHETEDQAYISIISRDGANLRRFPLPIQGYLHNFKWSPDGSQILIHGGYLYIINADGTNFHRVTSLWHGSIEDYDWSPDSKRVVFSFDEAQDGDGFGLTSRIYIVNADGTYQHLLTHEEVVPIEPGELGGVGSMNPVWQPVASRK